MRRRAFLRGIGAVGGAALSSGFSRVGRGATARIGERFRAAGLSVAAVADLLDDPAAAPFGKGAVSSPEVSLGPGGSGRKSVPGGLLSVHATPVRGQPDAIEVVATLIARGRTLSPALSLRIDLARWSPDVYVVLPGACYAGNRFEARRAGYPPLLTERADIGPHVPMIVADIPRLELHPGPSRIDARATDLATPGVGMFWPESRLGLVALVDPTTELGETGVGVVENDERSAAAVHIGAPAGREARWTRGAAAKNGGERAGRLRAGERATVRVRLHLFDCADPPGLFSRMFALRKALTGPTVAAAELPFSAAFAAHEERMNRRFVERPGFYALASGDDAYSIWQTGWCGGLAATLPLLVAGTARSRERAWRTTSFLLAHGQAPSGFFHGVSDGKTWFDDGFSAPLPRRNGPLPSYRHADRWHLVRRSGDTLLCLMKQLALLDRRPEPVGHERLVATLSQGARRTADALVRLWERYHQLGQFADVETGDLIVGGSTSAGIVPAALVLASGRFKEEAYLHVAAAAAESFYTRYVAAGLSCGGPGDALQAPDSESAAALLESFVTLWEATGDRIWITRAEATAHLLASWVIAYEPAAADPARAEAGVRATGGVLSNAQSVSGSPGYVLASGDALFRLFRATGDRRLLDLLADTARNLAQYLRVLERPDTDARDSTDRRTDTGAWLERGEVVVPRAGMLDAIGLLTYTELPGLYVQIDRGLVFAFDHVEARLKERASGKLVVTLSNSTRAEAVVRIFGESSTEAAAPLPPGAIAEAPTVVVPAGASLDAVVPLPAMAARR